MRLSRGGDRDFERILAGTGCGVYSHKKKGERPLPTFAVPLFPPERGKGDMLRSCASRGFWIGSIFFLPLARIMSVGVSSIWGVRWGKWEGAEVLRGC
jgi:hypothetical protein